MIITAHLPLTSISQASLLFSPRPTANCHDGCRQSLGQPSGKRNGGNLASCRLQSSSTGTDTSPKAVFALKGLTAQEWGLRVPLPDIGYCFQFASLQWNAGSVITRLDWKCSVVTVVLPF